MIKLRCKMPNSEDAEPGSAKWRCRTRDCPKSLVGARGIALQIAQQALFDPFRLPHSVPIHLRSVAKTPFRTVSPRTTLAIRVSGRAHHSRDPRMPVRLFAGRCVRATRKKSPSFASKTTTTSSLHEEAQRARYR